MDSILRLNARERTQLYQAASQQLGMADVIIEKDFWVCWSLRELFGLQGIGDHLLFKGGTSLSKVWRAIDRFSEDIDVSLSREWLGFVGSRDPETADTGKQQRARIENLATACAQKIESEILPVLRARARAALGPDGWALAIDAEDPQTLRFTYPTVLSAGAPDAYIRREVRIECGARSDDWPAEEKTIQPYVAEAYPSAISDAAVALRVLSIERTFWEKATILHAEAHREQSKATPSRYSRHYADLAALAVHASADAALARDDLRARVVEHKSVFFASAWASYETAVPGTFRLVPAEYRLAALEADYRAMQEMFFKQPRAWSDIVSTLQNLERRINGAVNL